MVQPTPGIYGWHHGSGGVHFYRMAEPFRVAKQKGARAEIGNILDDSIARNFDTVMVHMLHDERSSEAWEKLARNGAHRLIFDIDDVMWNPDFDPFRKHYTPDVLLRVARNIGMAHVVTTPTEYIADWVSTYNANVHVVPNTVPAWLLEVGMPERPTPAGRYGVKYLVGFQGSPSHTTDFTTDLWWDLRNFLRQNWEWGIHFWGGEASFPPKRFGVTPWQASVAEYYLSLSMDIGIGPLAPTEFNRGKSALRVIEYAALGIPAVVSDSVEYRKYLRPGTTGYLIEEPARPGAWLDTLNRLAVDPLTRQEMSYNARTLARGWTTEANIGRWLDAWNSTESTEGAPWASSR